MARWPCFMCGQETHDTGDIPIDGFYRGSNPWTCAKHVGELMRRWQALFPDSGYSWTEGGGIEITWDAMKRIEERFERNIELRENVYRITDLESYRGAL